MKIKIIYQIIFFNLIVLMLLFGSKLDIYYLEKNTNKKFSIIDEAINYEASLNYIKNNKFFITHPYSQDIGKDGKKYSKFPIGLLIFSIILGKTVYPINKYLSEYFISSTNIFLTGFIALVIFNFLFYIFKTYNKATFLTLLLIFGTPILYYSKSFFTQIPYTLGICLFMLGLYKLIIIKNKGEILIGLGLAISIISREESFIFVTICFIVLCIEYFKKNINIKRLLSIIFIFLIGVIFNFIYDYIRWGTIINSYKFIKGHPEVTVPFKQIFKLFFSPGKGIFIYSPFLIFFLVGLKEIFKNDKEEKIFSMYLFIILFINIIFYMGISHYYGGLCFGPRLIIPLIPLFFYFTIISFSYLKKIKLYNVFLFCCLISIITNLITWIIEFYSHLLIFTKNANLSLINGDLFLLDKYYIYFFNSIINILNNFSYIKLLDFIPLYRYLNFYYPNINSLLVFFIHIGLILIHFILIKIILKKIMVKNKNGTYHIS